MERYKPFIEDGATVVTSPHKVYGPETNDLVLQLRKRGIDRVILAGMSANLCTESHMRELMEQGFDVTVVSDGTALPITRGESWATRSLSGKPNSSTTRSSRSPVPPGSCKSKARRA